MRGVWLIAVGLFGCGGASSGRTDAATNDAHFDAQIDARRDDARPPLDPPVGTRVRSPGSAPFGCNAGESFIEGVSCDDPYSHIDCFGGMSCRGGIVTVGSFGPISTPNVCNAFGPYVCTASCYQCTAGCAPDWEWRRDVLIAERGRTAWERGVSPSVFCAEGPWDGGIDADASSDARPCPDEDGDGHRARACGGDDCDDGNPGVHPGARPGCDGVDRNCTGRSDLEEADLRALDQWCLDVAPNWIREQHTPIQCGVPSRPMSLYPIRDKCITCPEDSFCLCWGAGTDIWECRTLP